MKVIVITGAAGFIGYALLKKLSELNEVKIYAIDNLIKETDVESFLGLCDKHDNVHLIQGDINELDLPSRIVEDRIDVLYHLAAFNGTQNFYNRAFDVIEHTGLTTVNLIKGLRYKSIGRLVFAGTSESYAGGVNLGITSVPTSEKAPLIIDNILNQRWSYAASKIFGESAVISANYQIGVPFTIIRYHNVYGERMGVNHVIPDYLNRAKQNIFELYGHEDTRSFLYIDDAVKDTIDVALSPIFKNQIVNIGSEEEITILDLASRVNALLGVNAKIKLHPSPKGSVKRRMPDLNFINSALGVRERVSLEDGLKNTIKYYYAL